MSMQLVDLSWFLLPCLFPDRKWNKNESIESVCFWHKRHIHSIIDSLTLSILQSEISILQSEITYDISLISFAIIGKNRLFVLRFKLPTTYAPKPVRCLIIYMWRAEGISLYPCRCASWSLEWFNFFWIYSYKIFLNWILKNSMFAILSAFLNNLGQNSCKYNGYFNIFFKRPCQKSWFYDWFWKIACSEFGDMRELNLQKKIWFGCSEYKAAKFFHNGDATTMELIYYASDIVSSQNISFRIFSLINIFYHVQAWKW